MKLANEFNFKLWYSVPVGHHLGLISDPVQCSTRDICCLYAICILLRRVLTRISMPIRSLIYKRGRRGRIMRTALSYLDYPIVCDVMRGASSLLNLFTWTELPNSISFISSNSRSTLQQQTYYDICIWSLPRRRSSNLRPKIERKLLSRTCNPAA